MKVCGGENLHVAPVPNGLADDVQKSKQGRRYFPKVEDTATRRIKMAKFLKNFIDTYEEDGIDAAGCEFVKYWYDKTKQLLL